MYATSKGDALYKESIVCDELGRQGDSRAHRGAMTVREFYLEFKLGLKGLCEKLLAGLELLVHQLLAHPMIGHCMSQGIPRVKHPYGGSAFA